MSTVVEDNPIAENETVYVSNTASRISPELANELNIASSISANEWEEILSSEKLTESTERELVRLGWDPSKDHGESVVGNDHHLIRKLREEVLRSPHLLSCSDEYTQAFLNRFFAGTPLPPDVSVKLPGRSAQVVLDEPGMARKLSIPKGELEYETPQIQSYVLGEEGEQGILNNPASSKRTTVGTFHVVEGGQTVPAGKTAVPKDVGAQILSYVLNKFPKEHPELMEVPYTASSEDVLQKWVTLNFRPTVMPALPGISCERFSEVSVLAPGRFVSNADFLEEIFGNSGDPFGLQNDPMLEVGWSGTTHKIIFAPELHKFLTKKELGISSKLELEATIAARGKDSPEGKIALRRIADKMYWEDPAELYNNGGAFKMVLRDASGNSVTVITDNYYGYGKKSIKSEAISLVSNIMGLAEEEHAGGALAIPRDDIGRTYSYKTHMSNVRDKIDFNEVKALLADRIVDKGSYAVDKYLKIIYLDDDASINVHKGSVYLGDDESLPLNSEITYMLPDGRRINFEREQGTKIWRLVLTHAEGVFVHKPSTVSGAGKSEISKMLFDAMSIRNLTVNDFDAAISGVAEIIERDFGDRFNEEYKKAHPNWDADRGSRSILDRDRSLGSVIKLLTVSDDYTPEYNQWITNLDRDVRKLLIHVKIKYRPEMGQDWHEYFTVDTCDGAKTRVVRFKSSLNERPVDIKERQFRAGFEEDGKSERKLTMRPDVMPAAKWQEEDDISSTATISANKIKEGLSPEQRKMLEKNGGRLSVKLVQNAEFYLFQRPDGAKNRGEDRKSERDFSSNRRHFYSNFEALTREDAKFMVSRPDLMDDFQPSMRERIEQYAAGRTNKKIYFVSSDQARIEKGEAGSIKIVFKDGKCIAVRSDNPRYLEPTNLAEDLTPKEISDVGNHLSRKVKVGSPIYNPVDAVISGQRFGPAEEKINPKTGVATYTKPLLTNNPLHYMPLIENAMMTIPSLTVKSVSTTGGAGTEGVNTKEAFNALPGIYDIEASIVSMILNRTDNFVSASGYIGPKYKIGHDVSLLIPEVWCRMTGEERSAAWLIKNGYLEKISVQRPDGSFVEDTDLLGYRSTKKFWLHMGGRVFNAPDAIFLEDMLKVEQQSLEIFEESLKNIRETQKAFAQRFFDDGTIELASEPVRALLHIMRDGSYSSNGKVIDRHSQEFRDMFTYDYLLQSDWYKERIVAQQKREIDHWNKRALALREFISRKTQSNTFSNGDEEKYRSRLAEVERNLKTAQADEFREALIGTIGVHANTLNVNEGYVPSEQTMSSAA